MNPGLCPRWPKSNSTDVGATRPNVCLEKIGVQIGKLDLSDRAAAEAREAV